MAITPIKESDLSQGRIYWRRFLMKTVNLLINFVNTPVNSSGLPSVLAVDSTVNQTAITSTDTKASLLLANTGIITINSNANVASTGNVPTLTLDYTSTTSTLRGTTISLINQSNKGSLNLNAGNSILAYSLSFNFFY